MDIPKKLIIFFEQNKSKNKKEILKDMIEIFNYTETTALLYYSHRNSNSNRNSSLKSNRKLVFEFLKENLSAVYDNDNKKYANELGVKTSTYANYKMQYQDMDQLETTEPKVETVENKYSKERLRGKLTFDDSKLFG